MTLTVALGLALSCAKEPVENIKPSAPAVGGGTVTLRLSASETKTTLLNDKTVVWTAGDKILINGDPYEVTVDADDSSKATVEDVVRADEYYAFYVPQRKNAQTGEDVVDYWYLQDGDVWYHNLRLRGSQDWRSGTFAQYANPMAAYGTETELHFRNIGSVVKVGLTGNGEQLSNVRLLSNSGVNIAGMLKFTDAQIREGNLSGMEFNANYSSWLSPSVSIDCESGDLALSSSATWFYFVTAPFGDEAGISFVAEDLEGNVFVRTKTDAFSVDRSEIKEMPLLSYKASAPISLTAGEPAPTSISVDAVCDDGISVVYVAFASAAWDKYMNSESGGWTQQSLAETILNVYDSQTAGGGTFRMVFTEAYNYTGNAVPISAETSYKVIARYCIGGEGIGKCTVFDVTTAAATGTPPALDVSFTDVSYSRISALLKSGDAAAISLWMFTKTAYEQLAASGKSDSEIMKEYGKPLTAEDIGNAQADGCSWSWWSLSQGTDYVLLVVAASSTGMETLVKKHISTEWYIFNPNTTVLETVSTEATFTTDLFNSFFNVNFSATSLVLKKVPGIDVFVLENVFKGNEELMTLGFTDEEGTFLTIFDARNPNAVDIVFTVNRLGISRPGYLGFDSDYSFGCYATYNTSLSQDEFPLGTYDADSNTISVGNLCHGNASRIYGLGSCTLTWPAATGTMTIESFSKTQSEW